jgi:FtsP/CotA-like multicopper oxidase with cupredoxin domain
MGRKKRRSARAQLIEVVKPDHDADLTRRSVIVGGASLLASALISGCRGPTTTTRAPSRNRNIGIDGRDYSIAPPESPAREFVLEARPTEIEIAQGRRVSAWAYNGQLPGPEIRVREGERVRISVRCNLPQHTSVHWHGIPQRGTNNMDGVPGVTQDPIGPGATFVYDFLASPAGTYLFHPHSGLQLERGLYGPFIIEPQRETLSYDREYTLIMDDWLDGPPEDAYARLVRGEMQPGHSMPDGQTDGMKTEGASGGGKQGAGSVKAKMEEGPDVAYSTFLINGRAPEAAPVFETKRGERVRLRLINPSGSTMFRFAIGGHKMTVTHADGLAVQPVEVDTLEISMGERYDVLVAANSPGVWPIVAVSTDESSRGAQAILRYTDASGRLTPPVGLRPNELKGRLLTYDQLVGAGDSSASVAREPDRSIEISLGGQMMPYQWKINGKLYPDAEPFELRAGERVRVRIVNDSMMRHPMHLHGHSFQLLTSNQQKAPPFKDTAFVEPNRGTLEFEFLADNPGDWFFHCHHAYHLEAGMARVFKYV